MTLSSRHKIRNSSPGGLKAEHATSRSQRLPTILSFTRGWGRNIFVSFKPPRPGTESWTVKGSGANHYPRAPAHDVMKSNGKPGTATILGRCFVSTGKRYMGDNSGPTLAQRRSWSVFSDIWIYMNIALRRFLHNHDNIATERSLKPGLFPTLISNDSKGSL